MFGEILTEMIVEKAIEKAYQLIMLGYRKMDSIQHFSTAYNNALSAYKNEYGEDELYIEVFKTDNYSFYFDNIKEYIDKSSSTRELEQGLFKLLCELLKDIQPNKINTFIVLLFTELLFTEEYKLKILDYRQDFEIGKIYDMVLELKNYIMGAHVLKVTFSNNKYQEFLDRWNSPLFLHRNATNRILLKDLYVLPLYKEKNSDRSKLNRADLDEKIDMFLGDSIIGNRGKPMIILADAGMGKTSLVAYICSKCPQKENLLVLRFADLNKETLNKNILSAVLRELNCEIEDLRNKRLIIDGFDECEITFNKDKQLSNFLNDCQNIYGLKVLITSRVNYIDCTQFTSSKLYYLQFMNEEQIKKMSEKYFEISKEPPFEINILANSEVIGVPLILYMILALKIDMKQVSGICELYERIFALEGGIYDRMAQEDYDGYSEKIHPIAYQGVKKEVHLISEQIAFSMFEEETLLLPREKYIEIVKNVSENRVNDFAISNYYYIEESTYNLSFSHKSIYEYFVAEYLFNCINFNDSVEIIAQNLAFLSKKALFSEEILRFLIYKIKVYLPNSFDKYIKLQKVVNWMVEHGMTYFLKDKITNVLYREKLIFLNIFKLLDAYYEGIGFRENKYIDFSQQLLSQFNNRYPHAINMKSVFIIDQEFSDENRLSQLDLSNSIIQNVNFHKSNLKSSNFKNAKLNGVAFISSNLEHVSFMDASLSDINMTFTNCGMCAFILCAMENITAPDTDFHNSSFDGTKLNNIDFKNSNLSGVDFQNTSIINADFRKAKLNNIDFRGAFLHKINFREAELLPKYSIKVDEETIFQDVVIDAIHVPKLLLCRKENLIDVKVFDSQKNKEISLEEYLDIDDSQCL